MLSVDTTALRKLIPNGSGDEKKHLELFVTGWACAKCEYSSKVSESVKISFDFVL